MAIVAPTILTETLDDYKTSIDRLAPFAKRVHIDISDGEFAPNFLLGEAQLYWPKEWEVDIHAMVSRPSEHIAQLINLKPNLIIFHAEIQEDRAVLVNQIKTAGIKAGVALLRSTVPSTLADIIRIVDHVMIFSGELGKNGGTASLMQLEKVRLVKAINPAVEIGWDGGVNLENAYTLAQGNVNVLNAGSAISGAEDPAAAYEALTKEINKHGVI
ncbi:MAG: rpe [Candidatus Saccharibacteria bacterium]|nr:rpe [Candidatus Saccharibacteria bacterium]